MNIQKIMIEKIILSVLLIFNMIIIITPIDVMTATKRHSFNLVRSIPINEGEEYVISIFTDLKFINKDKVIFCDEKYSAAYILDLKSGNILHFLEADTSLSMILMNSNDKPPVSKHQSGKSLQYVDKELLNNNPSKNGLFEKITNIIGSVFIYESDYLLITFINPICTYNYKDTTKMYTFPFIPSIIHTDSTLKIKSIKRLRYNGDTIWGNNSKFTMVKNSFFFKELIYCPAYFSEVFMNNIDGANKLSLVSYNLQGEFVAINDSLPKTYSDSKINYYLDWEPYLTSAKNNLFSAYSRYYKIKNITKQTEFSVKYIDSSNKSGFNSFDNKDFLKNKWAYLNNKLPYEIYNLFSNNEENILVVLSKNEMEDNDTAMELERYILEYNTEGTLLNEYKINFLKNEKGYLDSKMYYNKFNDTYLFIRFSKELGTTLEEYKWE